MKSLAGEARRGKRPSATLVRTVWDHAREIHSRNENIYPDLVEEARSQLPEYADDPQFPYIVRRLWIEQENEKQAFWEHFMAPTLRSEYRAFDADTDWAPEGLIEASWITAPLVQRTLSVWQPRLPYLMGVDHALRMVRSVGRIADLGVHV